MTNTPPVRHFKRSKYDDEDLHRFFEIRKKKGWSIRKAWKMLQRLSDGELEKYVLPIFYRPFDTRWIFYHDAVVWRTVRRVMAHMLQSNLALVAPRRVETTGAWQHAFLTNVPVEHVAVSLKTIDYVLPLYLYPEVDREDLLSRLGKQREKKANLGPTLIESLEVTFGQKLSPEQIFHYLYAVLYAPTYRATYSEPLKRDFPRVPFTKDGGNYS